VEIERSASGGELFELNLASDVGADVFHRVGGVYGRGELLVVPFDVWYCRGVDVRGVTGYSGCRRIKHDV
jgi:hypothetical protein